MLLWFAVMGVVVTFVVFQSPMIDYRLVALGAVLPVLEVPWGAGPMHSLLGPTVVLVVVMAATVGRRLVRRQWLGLPIGMYLHLVLDAAWAGAGPFWWPFNGADAFAADAPEVARGPWSLALEAVAVLAGVWAWRRFGLDDPDRRGRFVRTGQLDRAVVGPGGAR